MKRCGAFPNFAFSIRAPSFHERPFGVSPPTLIPDVQLAFDNSPVTRWRSWQHAHAGMYIQVDFGRIRTVDAVRLEMPEDWIHPGLKVEGLDESGKWEDLGAKREIAVHPVTVNLRSEATSELKARGIRYLLIGNDDIGAEDFQQHAKYWASANSATGLTCACITSNNGMVSAENGTMKNMTRILWPCQASCSPLSCQFWRSRT